MAISQLAKNLFILSFKASIFISGLIVIDENFFFVLFKSILNTHVTFSAS